MSLPLSLHRGPPPAGARRLAHRTPLHSFSGVLLWLVLFPFSKEALTFFEDAWGAECTEESQHYALIGKHTRTPAPFWAVRVFSLCNRNQDYGVG